MNSIKPKTKKTARRASGSLDRLVRRLTDWGQDEDAKAVRDVDALMREYAYTVDAMTDEAAQFAAELRDWSESWKTPNSVEIGHPTRKDKP